MIIRKPFAFLIKYFKIIHIILFILMTYLLFKYRSIHLFFRDYIKTGNYFLGLINEYVNIFMIIANIILIISLIAIIFLMKEKKKPIIYYISSLIFYIISFISLFIFLNVFIHLEEATYSNQTMVILRDFSMVLYYASYYFLAVSFARGFGFNIKKFNFEKDIQELDINEKDREEIEIKAIFEYDDVSNYLRKKKRNLTYYLKENSFILTILLIIITAIITINFILQKFVYNPIYSETHSFTANNITYTINQSYSTNVDKLGNVINENKNFYVIDFSVINKSPKSQTLNISKTRIKLDNKYYYPKYAYTNQFSDLGQIYKNQTLKTDIKETYLLVFEIPKELKNKKPLLEIYYGSKQNGGDITFYYKNVQLKPLTFEIKNLGEYSLNESINLKNTYLGETKFNLHKLSLNETIDYKYTKCENKEGTCLDYNNTVVPSLSKTLLKIEYSSDIQLDIFDNVDISYTINNKNYNITNLKDVTPSNYPENNKIFEVTKNILKANNIKIIFNARGVKFTYIGDINE